MVDAPRQKLIDLIGERPKVLLLSPTEFENLLNDVLRGAHKRERKALGDAVREGVVGELRGPRYVPTEVLVEMLSKKLHEHVGTDLNLARWAVTSWNLALATIRTKSKTPGRAQRWVMLGEQRFHAGEIDHAVEAFETVIRMEEVPPDLRYRAILNLGVVHFTNGMTEKGLARFTSVIKDSGALPFWRVNALINRGTAHCKLQAFRSGIADFTEVLTKADCLSSQEATALAKRGAAYGKAQRFDLAALDLSGAIAHSAIKPRELMLARYNRGVICAVTGSYGEAMDDLELVIRNATNRDLNLRGRKSRGLVLMKQSEFAAATSDFDAILAEPGSPALTNKARFFRGLAQMNLHKWDQAAGDFGVLWKESSSTLKEKVDAAFYLGLICHETEQVDEAVRCYQYVIDNDSSNPKRRRWATTHLNRLKSNGRPSDTIWASLDRPIDVIDFELYVDYELPVTEASDMDS